MFHRTITLSVLALLVAVASCRPQVELNECSGRENGLYADASDSNAYFVCIDNELIVHSKCDPGEYFDLELKACTGGSQDQDLTAYSDDSEVDYAGNVESKVSDLMTEALDEEGNPCKPPQRPPNVPPPPPPGPLKNKIINVQVTKNIFPKSIIVIGRANREQKNK